MDPPSSVFIQSPARLRNGETQTPSPRIAGTAASAGLGQHDRRQTLVALDPLDGPNACEWLEGKQVPRRDWDKCPPLQQASQQYVAPPRALT